MSEVDGGCAGCATATLGFEISFAFQPIVDVRQGAIFSYEALVRGPHGESARWVLNRVDGKNRYRFDQACRVGAISLAARLGMTTKLDINFMPNAVYRPETCIRSTFAAAEKFGFAVERIVFEVLESDQLVEASRLVEIMQAYKRFGFLTAIDDFGAGYGDLNLLAQFQPDILKLDIALVRDIHTDRPRQTIVRGIVSMCRELGVRVLAEGVESAGEYRWLRDAGVDLFQGYFFARPAFEALPAVDLGALAAH